MKSAAPEQLTLARFQSTLQTTFRVQCGAEPAVGLVLVEATGGRKQAAGGGDESFSIVFEGPADRPLPQRIYSLEHDTMGRFDLFMVPVGQKESAIQYQAVFNRCAAAS